LAISRGEETPEKWGKFAFEILKAQGDRIVKEGVTLEVLEENLAELIGGAEVFSQIQFPLLNALQVI